MPATCLNCGTPNCGCYVLTTGLLTTTGSGLEGDPILLHLSCEDVVACVGAMLTGVGFTTGFASTGADGEHLEADDVAGHAVWAGSSCVPVSFVTYFDDEVPGVGDAGKTTVLFPDDWVNPATLAPIDPTSYTQQEFTLDVNDYLVTASDNDLTDTHEMGYMTIDRDLDPACGQYIEAWVSGLFHEFDGGGLILPEGQRTNGAWIELYVHGSSTTLAKQGLYFAADRGDYVSGDPDMASSYPGRVNLEGLSYDADGNEFSDTTPFYTTAEPDWFDEPYYHVRLEVEVDGTMRLYFADALVASGAADLINVGPRAGVALHWYTPSSGPPPRISRIETGTLA